MRIAHLAALSMLYVGMTACGNKDEDCSDNADNDGDAAVDCDDSDCNADAACEGGDADTDADSDSDSDSDADVDCANPENCGEVECAGIAEACDEVDVFMRRGAATITPTAWTGTVEIGDWAWPIADAPESILTGGDMLCMSSATENGVVHPSASDCDGCDFAFETTISNTSELDGDLCSVWGYEEAFTTDGATYGFGYNPTYDNDGEPVAALMYFSEDDGWFAVNSEVKLDGDDFSYAAVFGTYYY